MKGALIEFSSAPGSPTPNVVAFQFNPETLRRTWTPPSSSASSNPLAVQGNPGESYAVTLMLDSNDVVAEGASNPGFLDALSAGLASRLAALELLMFPDPPQYATRAPGGGRDRPIRSTPSAKVPTVLFMWGPGRILPVRITSLSITERLFDELLNPTQATVELGFRVLTASELRHVSGPFEDAVIGAYDASIRQRVALGAANVAITAATVSLPPLPGPGGP